MNGNMVAHFGGTVILYMPRTNRRRATPSDAALTRAPLTRRSDAGSLFAGWGGDDDCLDGVLTLMDDVLCTAVFDKQERRRAVRH